MTSDAGYDAIIELAKAKKSSAQPTIAKGTESLLPLDKIGDRQSSNVRELTQKHVEALAGSIAALGLIEPLVVDQKGRLLAGAHRRAAIQHVREQSPDEYKTHFPSDMVPVRVMPFDSEQDPDLAVEIEISENEIRRDFSRDEVLAIAEKLKALGYQDDPGRPKKGEKRLRPALGVIFGKSIQTIRRYLNEPTETPQETRSDERVLRERYLKQSLSNLQKWSKVRGRTKQEVELSKLLPDVITAIEALLKDD